MFLKSKYYFRFSWFCVPIFIMMGTVSFAQQYDVKTLLQLHRNHWERIKKLDVTYTARQRIKIIVGLDALTGTKAISPKELEDKIATGQVSIKNQDESLRYHWQLNDHGESLQHLPLPTNTNPNDCYVCIKYDGRYFIEDCVVLNRAASTPLSLQESLDNDCRLILRHSKSVSLSPKMQFPKATMLGMIFYTTGTPPVFQDLCSFVLSSDKTITTPVKSIDANGNVCWQFRVYPDLQGMKEMDESDKPYYEIAINESKGFCLHRFSVYTPASLSSAELIDGEKLANFSERVVQEYTNPMEGIYFPSKIISGFGPREVWESRTNLPENFYTREYNIEKVLINDQVKEEPCFVIPEFYIVLREDLMKDESKEGDFIPISIWGKNNEPLVTFMTRKEFNKYMKEVAAYPLPSFAISKIGLFLLVIGMIMTVTALIMLYRQRGEEVEQSTKEK